MAEHPPITSSEFADALMALLDEAAWEGDNPALTGASIRTFGDAALMTVNDGLVVRLADGSEFQVTVVQSRAEGSA